MSDNELRKQIMSMIRNSNLDETMFSVGIGEDYDKQRNRFVYDFSNKKNKEPFDTPLNISRNMTFA
mgnify:CR=1 FL=1